MTHWRKFFDYRFISAEELTKDTTVTIKEITQDTAFNGKEKETVTVLKFEKTDKGMVLNKTNAKAIATTLGTPDTEKWIGKQITLTSQKVNAFGQRVDAIRIKLNPNNYA